jgi:tetratricopeptide (TPR) repeat protein
MRLVWTLAAILTAYLLIDEVQAFDRCDKFFAQSDELRKLLLGKGLRDAPMKYFEQARSIGIETEPGAGGIIARATLDPEGRAVIVYPTNFPPVLCRMTLATFLVTGGDDWRPFAESARNAASCADSSRSLDDCLIDYGRELEERYRKDFEAQDEQAQRLAYAIAGDAVAQIGKHEYAHHLLGHADRIRSGSLVRIDAEFEADFYALQNALQSGEVPSAMFYFFKPLADLESYSDMLKNADYESSPCRATNVEDISGLFGLAPMVLLDAVRGGGDFRNPPDLRNIAEELSQKPPPTPSAKSCGRLAEVVLREAHGELMSLTNLVAEHAEVLRAIRTNTDPAGGLGLNAPEVFTLIDRLQAACRGFTHLKNLAARAMSILILRVEYAGKESAVSSQLDQVVRSLRDDILARDYARILRVKGVNVLYGAPNRPLEARMDEAQPLFEQSLTLQPASETRANLIFIATARGDCDKAAEIADKFVSGAEDDERSKAEALRDRAHEYASSGRCAEEAAAFASTFAR